MKRIKNRINILFICSILLLPNISFAQRVEVSAIGAAIFATGGFGTRLKIGPESKGWNINGGINTVYMMLGGEGGGKLDPDDRFMVFAPYIELAPSHWVGVGFSSITIVRNRIIWVPLAILTTNFPIRLYNRLYLLPSIQLQFPIVKETLPLGVIGLGVAFPIN